MNIQQMKNKMINVLLLGGGQRVSLAELLKRSGEKAGFEIKIVSYDLTRQVPVSLVGEVVEGLPWNHPEIVEDIMRVVKEKEISIILPIVNGSVEPACRCKNLLPDVFIPVTEFDTAIHLFDKIEAAKAFKNFELPIPKTYSILSAKIPVIAKPRKGGSSKGIRIFYDMEDFMHLKDLQNYIVQEYIENAVEYTVDAYITSDGEILVTVPRKRIVVMGGESNRSQTCRNELLENLSRKIIELFKMRGPVNLQFIHDLDSDRYLLLEVNPRLAGAVVCSIYAGAPITDYIIRESLGLPLEACNDWMPGTLMCRYSKEAIFHEQGS